MRKMIEGIVLGVGFLAILVATTGCEKTDRSFSLAQGSQTLKTTATYVPRKIDILWVVDNSNSMLSSQQNLTNNFSGFISRFQSLSFDFKMGFTGTDAYKSKYSTNTVGSAGYDAGLPTPTDLIRLRDGRLVGRYVESGTGNLINVAATHSGSSILDNTMSASSITSNFVTNASQYFHGSGDERAFESMKDVLSSSENTGFNRSGAYFAVIVISDEDDFSSKSSKYLSTQTDASGNPGVQDDYNSPSLQPLSIYKDYLDTLVGAGSYSVNVIAALDSACVTALQSGDGITGRKVGTRYMQMADLTGGEKVSLCDPNFANALKLISDKILEVASEYTLEREPVLGTIAVSNNGVTVPESSTNGWSYDSATKKVSFHGTALPSSGDNVVISFDPVSQTF